MSINENECAVINNLSKIMNTTNLEKGDELVSLYKKLRTNKKTIIYAYCTAFTAELINCRHAVKWKQTINEEIDS